MSKRSTSYCDSWSTEVHRNLDGIDELYDWVTSVRGDKTKAKCSLCLKSHPFSISSGGISDVKRHAGGKEHRRLIKERSSQRTLTSKGSSLSVGVCEKDKVTKAEILQALKVVDANASFASAADDGDRFREMFPDSNIAKKYKQGETKTKYCIEFGIAPYVKAKLI